MTSTTEDLGAGLGTPWRGPNPLHLTQLDVAAGRPIGFEGSPIRLPSGFASPIDAFTAVVAEAVARPPCVVLYSGGRDSSAVLAVAARVARATGMPDPLPVTVQFLADPTAEESEWQELVIRHLGITEWERTSVDDHLDLIGDRAAGLMRRHGLLWPAHAHLHTLALDHAQGGSVLSGIFGDTVFTPVSAKNQVRRVVFDRRRPSPRDVLRIGLAYSPLAVRRAVWSRRTRKADLPWLLEPARGAVRRSITENYAQQSARWDRDILRVRTRRTTNAFERSLELMAQDRDAIFRAPFGDPRFLAALAESLGRRGMDTRTEAMQRVFAADLPEAVLSRETKARFRYSYWSERSAAFAGAWDGTGFPSWVHPPGLRETWSILTDRDQPLPHTGNWAATPLQAAWLTATT